MGKDDLRKMIDEGDFTNHNNISFYSFDGDELILKMLPDSRHISDLNILHGGIIYTLADTATGILCRILGENYVTIDAHMSYISNTPKGVEIFAKARFVHKGKTVSVCEVEVYTRDKLLTKGTFTYHVYIK